MVVWRTAVVIVLIATVAFLVRAEASDSQRLSGDFRVIEKPAAALADGAPPGAAPPAVAGRVVEPVVAARRLDTPPACDERWSGGPPELPVTAARLAAARQAVLDRLGPSVGWLDPTGLIVVREGTIEGLDTEAVCAGEPVAGGWRTDPALVQAAAAAAAAPAVRRGAAGVAFRAVTIDVSTPASDGQRWALVEQRGWWLAYDVTGRTRLGLAALVGSDREVHARRLLIVAGDGRLLADRVADPSRQVTAATGVVALGRPAALLERTTVGPALVCERSWCAWLARPHDDERLVAVAAHGWNPWDAPPLGAIGWCPSSRRLVGTGTGAEHLLDGRLALGDDGPGLWTWAVQDVGGTAVVDLAAGGPAGATPGRASLEGQRCEFPDQVWGVPESLLAQLRERAQYTGATINGRFLARDGFELRIRLDPTGAVHVSHRRP